MHSARSESKHDKSRHIALTCDTTRPSLLYTCIFNVELHAVTHHVFCSIFILHQRVNVMYNPDMRYYPDVTYYTLVFSVLSCVLCIAMYSALFILDLSKNVMSPDDLNYHWTSDGHAHLDYSFYFILISTVLFLLNIVLLAVSETEFRPLRSRFSANMAEKSMDGVMMY